MNLSTLSTKFNTQDKCIAHLEQIRWAGKPVCPKCASTRMTKRQDSIKWHCNACNTDTSVLVGTIFEETRMPLPKWFQMIFLMLNAKKGISAMQISRDLGITYKSAWFAAMRIRCAMLDWGEQLEGIVEMDETYVGGKPRKRNKKVADNVPNLSTVYDREDNRIKRGRGTKKVPVVGIAERKGRVVARVMGRLTSKQLLEILRQVVNMEDSTLMTDDFRAYNAMDKEIERFVVQHGKGEYAKGAVHTNTIEGFWSIVKNGIKGQYHVISKKYLPFYLAEFCYRYNRRGEDREDAFTETLDNAITDDKCLVKYKPKGDVKSIAERGARRKEAKKPAARR